MKQIRRIKIIINLSQKKFIKTITLIRFIENQSKNFLKPSLLFQVNFLLFD
jgi:hypothetical protein